MVTSQCLMVDKDYIISPLHMLRDILIFLSLCRFNVHSTFSVFASLVELGLDIYYKSRWHFGEAMLPC